MIRPLTLAAALALAGCATIAAPPPAAYQATGLLVADFADPRRVDVVCNDRFGTALFTTMACGGRWRGFAHVVQPNPCTGGWRVDAYARAMCRAGGRRDGLRTVQFVAERELARECAARGAVLVDGIACGGGHDSAVPWIVADMPCAARWRRDGYAQVSCHEGPGHALAGWRHQFGKEAGNAGR